MANTDENHVLDPSVYSTESDQLTVELFDDGLVVVTLDNQELRNAMSETMTSAFGRVMADIKADSRPKCLIITGAGSAFCSGGDKTWLEDPTASVDEFRNKMLPFYKTWTAVSALEIPVVAAVNGAAVGAGAGLMLLADVRIGSPKARFSVPFLTLGMHPALGTTYSLPEVVGMSVARDLLYTCRMIDAKRMYEIDLLTEILEDDDFRAAAIEFGHDIAQRAPIATRLTKASLLDGGPVSLEAAIQWESVTQSVTLTTKDMEEGWQASKERRKPNFKGV